MIFQNIIAQDEKSKTKEYLLPFKESKETTRTRQLSLAVEKIIDEMINIEESYWINAKELKQKLSEMKI